MRKVYRGSGSIIVLLMFWWCAEMMGATRAIFFPTLSDVGASLTAMFFDRSFYVDFLTTVYRALSGLLIAFAVAVPIGLVLGRVRWLLELAEVPIDFFRSIPSSALFYLFIIVFGIGNASKIAVVVYGCALTLLISAAYGSMRTPEKQTQEEALTSMGATRNQLFLYSVLPGALPQIASGLRVAMSLALVLVIVTEMFLGGADGLGRRLYDNYQSYSIAEMYACLIVLGTTGYFMNQCAVGIERLVGFGEEQHGF